MRRFDTRIEWLDSEGQRIVDEKDNVLVSNQGLAEKEIAYLIAY